MKAISSKRIFAVQLLIAFLIIFVANFFTPIIADDYMYKFSFYDGSRVSNIPSIINSLKTHVYIMNGRLVAHFFVHLFDSLPPIIFDIVNSLFYIGLVILCYYYTSGFLYKQDSVNNLLLFCIIAGIWIFSPAFGQVYLWLAGSCNYLWGIVFAFIFILPFFNLFVNKRVISNNLVKVLFIFFSFLIGNYLEGSSSAAIYIAFCFTILSILINKNQKKADMFFYFLAIVSASLGFISIFLAPAELAKVSIVKTPWGVVYVFIDILKMCARFCPLFIIFFVLLGCSLLFQSYKCKNFIISIVFFSASIFSLFVLNFASYHPDRCFLIIIVLLYIATLSLLSTFSQQMRLQVSTIFCSILVPFLFYNVCFGLYDIYHTNSSNKNNLNIISSSTLNSVGNAVINDISAESHYSVFFEINNEDVFSYMAKYYGLKSISEKQ